MPDFPSIIDLSNLGSGGAAFEGEAADDQAGRSVSSAGDVNGDGFDDIIIGASHNGGYAGAAYLIFGKAGGFTPVDLAALAIADGFKILGDSTSDYAGHSVSSAGDINGDGYDDLIIGARGYGDDLQGAAYLIFGKASGFGTIDLGALAAADGFRIGGEAFADDAGRSVSSAGDVNGDGFDDLIVGARYNDSGGTNAGAAYVIFGKASGFGPIDLAALAPADGFKIQGDAGADQAGWSVSSAGDVNDDGFDDMFVGAKLNDAGDSNAGAAYVIFGKAGGFATIDLESLSPADGFKIQGDASGDNAGYSLSSAGDVNGDGFDDMIVGAPFNDGGGNNVGAAYLIFGKSGGFGTIDLSNLAAADGFKILGATYSAGVSVSAAGDVNGDGFDDFIVGEFGDNSHGTVTGAAWVIFGKAGPFTTIDLEHLAIADGFKIQGEAAGDSAGLSVAAAGDVDGDGFDDVLVGAPGADDYAGAAYVVYGRAPTTAVVRNGSAADQTIRGGAFDDVLNGLGGDDALYGGGGNDSLDGGVGDDSMTGGAGNDIYFVDSAGDSVAELTGEGTDEIRTALASYSLAALANVENLTGLGSGEQTLTGNDSDNLIDGGLGADAMIGGIGNDTYVVEDVSDAVTENANQGTDEIRTGLAAYSLAGHVNVENLTGTNAAGQTLTGNGSDNVIIGAGGNDTINGGAGADTMAGGAGNDIYIVDNAGDVVTENSGAGTDEIRTGLASYSIAALGNIEKLTGTNAAGQTLTGNGGNNVIAGAAGNDMIDGGAGTDTMAGGAGNDVYFADSVFDIVTELAGEGIDEVRVASAGYELGANVENLTVSSNIDHPTLRGNNGNNVITGGTGADWIDSKLGVDIVDGLGGRDTLWVEYAGAPIDPYAGAGIANAVSTVTSNGGSFGGIIRTVDGGSTVSFSNFEILHVTLDSFHNTFIIDASALALGASLYVDGSSGIDTLDADLSALASVDFNYFGGGGGDPPNTSFGRILSFEIFKLKLTAGADHVITGSGNDILLGNGGDDVLDSGGGNDLLDGGAGVDAMTGGTGDDVYVVDDSGDSVIENAGEGSDEIRTAFAAFSLASLANIENLTGTNAAGQTLTGSGSNNSITGAGGNDVIDGGLGADFMIGRGGDDIYFVDNAGDFVAENFGEGTDEIRTALTTYSIAGLAHVENLTATSNGNHDFRGNGGNNVVTGAGGNDFIRLQDGGVDTAVGAGGNDVFLFGATLTTADSVDGGSGLDQVAIQGDYSGGLTLGSGFVSIESFAILPGSDTRFGDTAGNFYSYNLTTLNSNVAPGVLMIIDANRLRVGENFTFNGSAETDGNFFLYGGGGTDTLLGGSNNDTFYFGENGQFGATDHVDGGVSGTDQLGLRGSYTITFGANQLTSIESIGLVSAQDTRFGALGTSYNYNLTMNDGNLAAGVRMTVDAAPLRPSETLTFNGSAELDGWFRIFGGQGSDTITGSQTGDIISGGLGSDNLRGAGGADTFLYRSVADSLLSARDSILDFSSGDLINLSQIDAISGTPANDAFTFIGSAAFSGTAGELRASFYAGNGLWTVSGDVNGDGVADIEFYVTSDHPIIGTDFVL